MELDVYERLRSFKRSGESFSDVARRGVFADSSPTGNDLLAYFRAGGSGVSESYLDALEEATK
jgi:hypothetical protein